MIIISFNGAIAMQSASESALVGTWQRYPEWWLLRVYCTTAARSSPNSVL